MAVHTDNYISIVASAYRDTQTVETLERVHRVTGQSFAVSGDAWLHRGLRNLQLRMEAEYLKARTTGER